MSRSMPDWDSYAKSTSSAIIRAHYFFSVWRNYLLLLHGLNIPQGTLLEIGSSTGQNSLRLTKKYNLQPTLVDSSKIALFFAKQLFLQSGIHPRLIHQDVLSLSLEERFDFVHSHGLLEHFKGPEQRLAFKVHVNHLSPNGWFICWVPTPDLPYRLNRWYLERTNRWIFGYEEPLRFSKFNELFKNERLIIRKVRHFPGWLGVAAQQSA
ncbi:MAG: class I SAM-dependent methyltransferase [Candidatus Hodarchaeota archaeon]